MNRHRLDFVSLIAGLATVTVAVALLVPGVDTIPIGRLVPAGIIAIGVALLLSGRSGERAEATVAEGGPAPRPESVSSDDETPAPTREIRPQESDDATTAQDVTRRLGDQTDRRE